MRVEAVLVSLPGESFVIAGQGISSRLGAESDDLVGRGVASVELLWLLALDGGKIRLTHLMLVRGVLLSVNGEAIASTI